MSNTVQKSPADKGSCLIKMSAVGLVVATVLAWTLLSAALSLPFMLGLFFFMLFGLIIGAFMFRMGNPYRPVEKKHVLLTTILVSIVCWGTAMAKECMEFPQDFVDRAMHSGKFFKVDTLAELRCELGEFIGGYLDKNYGSAGAIGYLRLAASGDPIVVDLPKQPKVITLEPWVSALTWWSRVLLSVVLLFTALYSVTIDLSKEEKTPIPDPEDDTATHTSNA